jgi:rSAM/selenodomain-associated transferase 1
VPTPRSWHANTTAVTTKVQVFARAPVSGAVKTRLIPRLGARKAARLQQVLTERALRTAFAANIGPVELWCTPDRSHPSFQAFAREGALLRDQGVGDIGVRMHRALSDALNGGDFAVLIGSDCPWLTAQEICSAAHALRDASDLVFVPAEDGGYVLIAARTCSVDLFSDIAWGSDSVMSQTRERLRELGLTWQELPARRDVDRPEDYDALLRDQPRILDAHA